jgi:esterase/lipase
LAARSNQEQQLAAAVAAAAAARDNNAIYQLYQRYAHDPEALQHHQRNYLAQAMSASKAAHENEVARMMDASHLVYHFASKFSVLLIG